MNTVPSDPERTTSSQPSLSLQVAIANILKDQFTVREIDEFFRVADADLSWWIEPDFETTSVRVKRALGWFEGINRHAPNEALRISISVAQQLSRNELYYERNKQAVLSILERLNRLAEQQSRSSVDEGTNIRTAGGRKSIFVGHGQDPAWGEFVLYLRDGWDADVIYFESENRTAQQNTAVVEAMTTESSVAVILMTSDDAMADGTLRARQNVIHEAGISHGRLGFDRVALLIQEGVQRFSNVDGIQYIPYDPRRVRQCLHDLGEFLERCGIGRK